MRFKRSLSLLLCLLLLFSLTVSSAWAVGTVPVAEIGTEPSTPPMEPERLSPPETEDPTPPTEPERLLPPEAELAEDGPTSGTCGEDLTWVLDDGGTLTIRGTGAMWDFGWQGAPWNGVKDAILSVVVESGVTVIGGSAFGTCAALRHVELPEGLIRIGDWSFAYSTLAEITIPDSVTSIGYCAFYQCGSLKQVRLGTGVEAVGAWAFGSCVSLMEITIPDSVTEMGDHCFVSCEGLKTAVVGRGLTELPEYLFDYCTALTNVTLRGNVTKIQHATFGNCHSLQPIELKNTLKEIGEWAFNNNHQWKELTIPDSVTVLGEHCFDSCTSLETAVIGSGVTELPNNMFDYCEALTDVTLRGDVTRIGWAAFGMCKCLRNIELPGTLTTIEPWAFNHCGLTEITIPDSVSDISYAAFLGCGSLEHIGFGNALTQIGEWAFEDCVSLTELTLPLSLETVAYGAFNRCTGLTDVYYPGTPEQFSAIDLDGGNDWLLAADFHFAAWNGASGVCGDSLTWTLDAAGTLTIRGTGAMWDFDSWEMVPPWYTYRHIIRAVEVSSGVTAIGVEAFFDCGAMQSAALADSVTEIGWYAFENCRNLTYVDLGGGVTWIDTGAFSNCARLTELTIPASVETIGADVFCYCSNLTRISVNPGSQAFSGVNGVLFNKDRTELLCYPAGKSDTRYTVPESVTVIGASAFCGCSRLSTVTLPDNLFLIRRNAFRYCVGLTSVTFPSRLTEIDEWAFSWCTALTEVHIPAGVKIIDRAAFAGCSSLTGIEVDPNNQFYCSIEGVLFSADRLWLLCYPAGKSDASYTVPDEVTTICFYAFYQSGSLTAVTIPNRVTDIERSAFMGCRGLEKLYLGTGVRTIARSAFSNCDSLTDVFYAGSEAQWSEIDIQDRNDPLLNAARHDDWTPGSELVASGVCGDSLTWELDVEGTLTIRGTGAMTDYGWLDNKWTEAPWYELRESTKRVIIEDGVTSIGNEAFRFSALESVSISDSVIKVGSEAFYFCAKLKEIAIPTSINSIARSALLYCSSLESIDVADSNNAYCSVDGILFNKAKTTLLQYPCAKPDNSYMVPETVSFIGDFAFTHCNNLKNVTIPDGVVSIGEASFHACSALERIRIPANVASIGYRAFCHCSHLTEFDVVADNQSYSSANGVLFNKSKTSLIQYPNGKPDTSYTIPFGVTVISDASFEGCNLVHVILPDSVTSTGNDTFCFSNSLRSVMLPSGLTNIEGGAFYGCYELKDVFYKGTETQWNKIEIGEPNDALKNATLHCNDATDAAPIGSGFVQEVNGAQTGLVFLRCPEDTPKMTVYGARYSAEDRFLGLESVTLEAGQQELLVLNLEDGSYLKIFAVDSATGRPLCEQREL